jgi:hypothetical protein
MRDFQVVEGAQCDLMEQHLKTPACLTGNSPQPLHYISKLNFLLRAFR